MKTNGLENAIRRLEGARKLQSPFLIARAEEEARHLLTQTRTWLTRAAPAKEGDERHKPIADAADALEAALAHPAQE
jgi:hypothetical protein